MTIQQAIEKAVESGYDAPVLKVVAHFKEEQKYADVMTEVMMVRNVYPAIFLDPLFWQSLGKAMGWGCYHDKGYTGMMSDINSTREETYYWWVCSFGECPFSTKRLKEYGEKPKTNWKKEWHRFIDHLAEGKDAESFFETL